MRPPVLRSYLRSTYSQHKGEFAPSVEQRTHLWAFWKQSLPERGQPCFWGDGGPLPAPAPAPAPAPGNWAEIPWRIRSPSVYLAPSMACCILNFHNNHALGKARCWGRDRRIWRGFLNNRIVHIPWHTCAWWEGKYYSFWLPNCQPMGRTHYSQLVLLLFLDILPVSSKYGCPPFYSSLNPNSSFRSVQMLLPLLSSLWTPNQEIIQPFSKFP